MQEQQTLVVPGQLSSLDAVTEFYTQAGLAAGLGKRGVYDVQLAIDEAFSNIVAYAYSGGSDQLVECTYHISDSNLTIKLHDQGRSFDPDSVPEPDIGADLESRTLGGLGIYIIRQIMDEVRFEFGPRAGNTLTMVKLREAHE